MPVGIPPTIKHFKTVNEKSIAASDGLGRTINNRSLKGNGLDFINACAISPTK